MSLQARLKPGQFFGNSTAERRDNDLLFSLRKYQPKVELPRHSHDAPFFCLLLNGSYEETYDSRKENHSPLSLVFHPAGDQHTTNMGTAGGSVFLIELGLRWFELLKDFPVSRARIEPAGGPLSWLAQQVYREMEEEQPLSLLLESLLCEMLARATQSPGNRRTPGWFPNLLKRVRDIHDSPFTVAQLAEDLAMHPFHLAKVFRYFYGLSIGEYVNRMRIARAVNVLKNSPSVRLCDLSTDLGFADQSHFTRIFARLIGSTPASFRRQYKS